MPLSRSNSGKIHAVPQAVQRAKYGALLVLASFVLVACDTSTRLAESSRPTPPGVISEPNFNQFSDVPIPAGADMDLERSLVLGEQDAWIGRLVMEVGANPGKTFDFYFGEMPRFGWFPITTVRAETSVLTYARAGRIATIQVWGRTLTGSTISMTESPKGQVSGNGNTAAQSNGTNGTFNSVTTSPLR